MLLYTMVLVRNSEGKQVAELFYTGWEDIVENLAENDDLLNIVAATPSTEKVRVTLHYSHFDDGDNVTYEDISEDDLQQVIDNFQLLYDNGKLFEDTIQTLLVDGAADENS